MFSQLSASGEIKPPASLVLAASQLTLLTGCFDLGLSGSNPVPRACSASSARPHLWKGHSIRSLPGGRGPAQPLCLAGLGALALGAMRARSLILLQRRHGHLTGENPLWKGRRVTCPPPPTESPGTFLGLPSLAGAA